MVSIWVAEDEEKPLALVRISFAFSRHEQTSAVVSDIVVSDISLSMLALRSGAARLP